MRKYSSFFTLVLFLTAWEISIKVFKVKQFILPPPSKIFLATWDLRKALFFSHLPVTLLEIGLGLIISVLLSVLLAVVMLKAPQLEQAIYPFLVASQTIPIIVLSPIIIMWFGYGLAGKVAITVLITFFPIVVNTFAGLKNVDQQYINLLKTMGASPQQIFWKVRVPASLPSFFTGLKVGAAVSVIGAVIGEWMGGNAGLGAFSKRMTNLLKADAVFAAVFILALVGIALFGLVRLLELKTIPWYFKTKNNGE